MQHKLPMCGIRTHFIRQPRGTPKQLPTTYWAALHTKHAPHQLPPHVTSTCGSSGAPGPWLHAHLVIHGRVSKCAVRGAAEAVEKGHRVERISFRRLYGDIKTDRQGWQADRQTDIQTDNRTA